MIFLTKILKEMNKSFLHNPILSRVHKHSTKNYMSSFGLTQMILQELRRRPVFKGQKKWHYEEMTFIDLIHIGNNNCERNRTLGNPLQCINLQKKEQIKGKNSYKLCMFLYYDYYNPRFAN